MFNNSFCEIKGKKVIHWGVGGGRGIGGTMLISSWKCNFSNFLDIQVYFLDIQVYFLDIQAITALLCLLLALYVLGPFIHSIFYITTALLKSDIFRHSKDYFSQSFGLTKIGLGSFWKGMKWVSKIISTDLFSGNFFKIN